MKQNIYDNEVFFNNYNSKRQLKKGTFANDLIEIPTIRLMLPPLTNLKILELGCGYGDNCSYFIKKKAKSVLGIDISQNMINLAQKNNNSPQIFYKVMAIEDIANLDEKFDLIISSLALHYVADLNQVLKDVYNLLNDGGYFIFSQEHPLETAPILNELCNNKDNIDIGNKNYYLLSDYNNNGKRVVDWFDSKVIKYHRNFSYIINSLITTGFSILEVKEPIPSSELLKIKPKYKNQFDKPYFLFFKLQKK